MSIIPSRWTRSAVVAFMAASLAAGSAAATTLQEGECLPPEGARTTGPAPLSVYGSLPATDLVDVSPSGRRLAYIAVIGEERSMVICDLETLRLIGGVRAGDVKVRALDWIGEDHVMLTTTATQSGTLTGLQRSELAEGQIYSIETRRVAKALDATPGLSASGGNLHSRRRTDRRRCRL